MKEPLTHHPLLKNFLKEVDKERSLLVEEPSISAKALLATLLQQKFPVVVVSDQPETFLNDLWAWGVSHAKLFPAWETLPSEGVPPSPELVGQRFEALSYCHSELRPLLVAPLQAALQKTVNQKKLSTLHLEEGKSYSLEQLVSQLHHFGYQEVMLAGEKGQFARRGGILDIFATNRPAPCRLEFFGSTLESLRLYDPGSQRSVEMIKTLTVVGAEEKDGLQSSLFDHLPKETWILFDDLVALEDRFLALKKIPGDIPSFQTLLDSPFPHLFFASTPIETLSEVKKRGAKVAFDYFDQTIEAMRWRSPFTPITEDQAGELIEVPHLSGRFMLHSPELLILPDAKAHRPFVPPHQRLSFHSPQVEQLALEINDLVVHFHHGIGRFCGLETRKNFQGLEEEFLVLEYERESKLFVPIQQAYLVSKYIGKDEELPTLSSLNSSRWKHLRQKSEAAIQGYAKELLQFYAHRSTQTGYDHGPDSKALQEFESAFEFEETPDQKAAIAIIKEEMHSNKCMDRLVCGDVGYGKTEVAMRAAFKAVVDGKRQVALLAPTTLLAQQHFETFSERMKGFGIRIGLLSRLCRPKAIKETLLKLKEGELDILIGTHRLLSEDVAFASLGLAIVDEEQRFGVKAKEKLKQLVAHVDCLTLSATPIPRTLYMSLVGVKDLSPINTPPFNRLPIKSILAQKSDLIFQQGLTRELARGGQAFVIHNRIESIHLVKETLEKLVPQARYAVAHGQMDPEVIDAVFQMFQKGTVDILVATTLVENGIDIPNANTIFIDQADHFGVADLYQLRGRVGRWNRRAYCYFLVKNLITLPPTSQKRLKALIDYSGYGGGLKIAMRDLELRGAGNLLGLEQSGHVATIGFHLYCKLLKRAIDQLHGNAPPITVETRLEFSIPAKLQESHIASSELRLEFYQRLGDAFQPEAIDALFEEIKDRFGPLPPATEWLWALSHLRLFASQKGITLLKQGNTTLTVERQLKDKTQSKSWLFTLPKTPKAAYDKILSLLQLFVSK